MAYTELFEEIKRVAYIASAAGVLGWDQRVSMPKQGVDIRSYELATLSEIAHELFTNKKIGDLIKKAKKENLNDDQKANIRELEKDYTRAVCIPKKLISELEHTSSKAEVAWQEARAKADFKIFSPHLSKLIELKKKKAGYIDNKKLPYDVLLQDYDYSLTTKIVENSFKEIKTEIKKLIKKYQKPKKPILKDYQKQKEICNFVSEKLGYDLTRGRLDISAHPFSTGNTKDARITTRFSDDPFDSLLSTMHETGHALYTQGLKFENFGTPLGEARSTAVHESQSRIWENHVGRSKEFLEWFTPILNKAGCNFTAEESYNWVNFIEPGFIRVESDEVTYHIHIILRFEIEKLIFENKLTVKEIPEVWNEKMQSYLNITPENDSLGCLQDIHWSSDFGYFPTYTFGTMIATQLFNTALKKMPNLKESFRNGNFSQLKEWLNKNIHQFGRKYETNELIKKATGEEPNPRFLISYLKEKYTV